MSDTEIVGPLTKPEPMRREAAFKWQAAASIYLYRGAKQSDSEYAIERHRSELFGMLIAAEALEEMELAAWLNKLLESEGL